MAKPKAAVKAGAKAKKAKRPKSKAKAAAKAQKSKSRRKRSWSQSNSGPSGPSAPFTAREGPQKILQVSQKVGKQAPKEVLFQELSDPIQWQSFPEGWTVKMSHPLPQDGRFETIKDYQESWEEALILETKAQFLSELSREHRSFLAQCADDRWILLEKASDRAPTKGSDLHIGSLVLIEGTNFASIGRVDVSPTNLKGISSKGLRRGATVTVTVLSFSLVSTAREIDAIRNVRHIPAVLVDQLLGQLPKQLRARGVSIEDFKCLESLNPSQTKAVVRAASNTAGFVSIHGPPGTGKSQALLALVNTLHIRKLGEYHRRIEEMVLDTKRLTSPARWNEAVCHFPRLLVTAHSNAAVEQLQQRARAGCFVDQNGGSYEPIHCRLSSYNAENDRSENVDAQLRELLSLDLKAVKAERQKLQHEMHHLDFMGAKLVQEIRRLQEVCPLPPGVQATLDKNQILYVDASGCQLIDRPASPKAGEASTQPLQLVHVTGRMEELVRCCDIYREYKAKVDRYKLMEEHLCGFLQLPFSQLKLQLEASILEFAHIVFATANTTARLRQLVEEQKMRPFDTVVVDEAAQATEPAVLVPLTLCGGRTAVLLGDHLQLPPTLWVPNADELLFSRSLFERLCVLGHEPELLKEQYRMAPEISAFPRNYFYEGRLQDAQVVQTRPRCELIPPFLFLNLKSSAERRPDGSFYNKAEACFCVKLVKDLQTHATSLGRKEVARSIGIITPYRAQKNFIDQLLSHAKLLCAVRVATVDAYQGQEFEAVICSTVRASQSGIGFLRDDRRLNVALTRAKQILFVVGHEQTLRQSKTLAALIDHAQRHDAFRNVKGTDDVLLTGD